MINLDNLNPRPNWPAKGFLCGSDLLDSQTLQAINTFDFSNCEPRPEYRFQRKGAEFYMGNEKEHKDEASIALQKLIDHVGRFEVLEHLIQKSFIDSGFNIGRFWANGIDGVRERYKGAGLAIYEDSQFTLSPHSDNRMVIANLQIYLSPNEPEIGTRFHEYGNHVNYETLPFVPNTGYFMLNTEHGAHSVVHNKEVPRRSILLGWNL